MMNLALVLFSLSVGVIYANPTNTGKHSKITKNTSHTLHAHKANNLKANNVEEIEDKGWEFENKTFVDTRRILYSKEVRVGKRPYMVYLQLTKESAKAHKYRGWLCGGVIVHPNYVLTSAACVEDAEHFYIVSGTNEFVDSFDYETNECVCQHRRRVVWKCIPKNYKFDFQDSIKWSSNDIAIVKVDRPFKIGVQESGCEFAADVIAYNNISRELEKPGTKGHIAGWGSGSTFREGVYRRFSAHVIPDNAKYLQEAKVCVMDNEQCARKWAQRFRSIISEYMICTKDVMKRISDVCDKKYANCTEVESGRRLRKRGSKEVATGKNFNVDLGRHLRDPDDYTARRSTLGGFCENDHGGPLFVKYQGKEHVVGVISACKIDPKSHSCRGPFLYTSIFRNRQFISCSIHKDVEESCRRVFRTGVTHREWSVNWDNVTGDEVNADEAADSSSSDDGDSSEELLRQNEKKTQNKDLKKEKESSSSNSSSSEEDLTIEKTKKKESKKNEKKHERSKKVYEKKREKGSKRVKEIQGHIKGGSRSEVFYESSKDDDVNELDE